jgi:hypothetical protein
MRQSHLVYCSTYDGYRKRFNIETLFSDLKSRGFNAHKSGLRDPERVSRLLIAVAPTVATRNATS